MTKTGVILAQSGRCEGKKIDSIMDKDAENTIDLIFCPTQTGIGGYCFSSRPLFADESVNIILHSLSEDSMPPIGLTSADPKQVNYSDLPHDPMALMAAPSGSVKNAEFWKFLTLDPKNMKIPGGRKVRNGDVLRARFSDGHNGRKLVLRINECAPCNKLEIHCDYPMFLVLRVFTGESEVAILDDFQLALWFSQHMVGPPPSGHPPMHRRVMPKPPTVIENEPLLPVDSGSADQVAMVTVGSESPSVPPESEPENATGTVQEDIPDSSVSFALGIDDEGEGTTENGNKSYPWSEDFPSRQAETLPNTDPEEQYDSAEEYRTANNSRTASFGDVRSVPHVPRPSSSSRDRWWSDRESWDRFEESQQAVSRRFRALTDEGEEAEEQRKELVTRQLEMLFSDDYEELLADTPISYFLPRPVSPTSVEIDGRIETVVKFPMGFGIPSSLDEQREMTMSDQEMNDYVRIAAAAERRDQEMLEERLQNVRMRRMNKKRPAVGAQAQEAGGNGASAPTTSSVEDADIRNIVSPPDQYGEREYERCGRNRLQRPAESHMQPRGGGANGRVDGFGLASTGPNRTSPRNDARSIRRSPQQNRGSEEVSRNRTVTKRRADQAPLPPQQSSSQDFGQNLAQNSAGSGTGAASEAQNPSSGAAESPANPRRSPHASSNSGEDRAPCPRCEAECVVCHVNRIEMVFFPCMCMCMCEECYTEYKNTLEEDKRFKGLCPMDRQPIRQVGKLRYQGLAPSG